MGDFGKSNLTSDECISLDSPPLHWEPENWETGIEVPEDLKEMESCLTDGDGKLSKDYKDAYRLLRRESNNKFCVRQSDRSPGTGLIDIVNENFWDAAMFTTDGVSHLTVVNPNNPSAPKKEFKKHLGHFCHVGAAVYACGAHPVLTNFLGQRHGAAFQPLVVDPPLSNDEIARFGKLFGDKELFYVTEPDKDNEYRRTFYIRNDGDGNQSKIEAFIELIQKSGTFSDEKRVEQIVKGLKGLQVSHESITLGKILGIIQVPLALAGILTGVFMAMWQIGKMMKVSIEAAREGAKASAEVMANAGKDMKAKVDVAEFAKDRTEQLKDPKYKVSSSVEDYVKQMVVGLRAKGHIVRGGPTGALKGVSIDALAHEIVMESSRIPQFKDGARIWFVRASQIRAAAGPYQNMDEVVLEALLERAREKPTVLVLTEADEFLGDTHNKQKNIFKSILTTMEGKNPPGYKEGDPTDRNVTVVIDSSQAAKIIDAVGDLKRRIAIVESIPPTPQQVLDAVIFNYEHPEIDPKEKRADYLKRVDIHPDALNAIALLGEKEGGAPSSSHIGLMDVLLSEYDLKAEENNLDHYEIAEHDVISFVARQQGTSEGAIENLLSQRKANPQLTHQAIAIAFYQGYQPVNSIPDNILKIIREGTNGSSTVATPDRQAEAERLLTERFGADWAEKLTEAKGVCQAPDLTIRDLLEAHETYSRDNQTTMPLEDFLDKIILPEVRKAAAATGMAPSAESTPPRGNVLTRRGSVLGRRRRIAGGPVGSDERARLRAEAAKAEADRLEAERKAEEPLRQNPEARERSEEARGRSSERGESKESPKPRKK